MVMVGPDLNIRRFTPQAAKVLGLTATDVGRPITRLRLKVVDVTDLEQIDAGRDCGGAACPSGGAGLEGRPCELRITPYWTSDNRIDGVILSLLVPDNPNPYSGEMTQDSPAPARKAKAKSPAKKSVKGGAKSRKRK